MVHEVIDITSRVSSEFLKFKMSTNLPHLVFMELMMSAHLPHQVSMELKMSAHLPQQVSMELFQEISLRLLTIGDLFTNISKKDVLLNSTALFALYVLQNSPKTVFNIN